MSLPKKSKAPPIEPDILRIERIFESLLILSRPDLKPHFLSDPEGFWNAIEPLTQALREGKWGLVGTAANDMVPREPHEQIKVEAIHMAFYMSQDPETFGVKKLTKTDILEYMRIRWPEHFETLPTSKRGLTDWWKKVGALADQGRGNISREFRRELEIAKKQRTDHVRQEEVREAERLKNIVDRKT